MKEEYRPGQPTRIVELKEIGSLKAHEPFYIIEQKRPLWFGLFYSKWFVSLRENMPHANVIDKQLIFDNIHQAENYIQNRTIQRIYNRKIVFNSKNSSRG